MAEETHREKAHTAGTLTTTMTSVFTSASRKVLSLQSRMKLFSPTKWPELFIFASVRLVKMHRIMGITTKPTKKSRLGSMNR